MAKVIMCDSEDGAVADLLVTQVANGDTLALCAQCVPLWAQAMAAELDAPVPEPPADVLMAEALEDTAAPTDPPAKGGDTSTSRGKRSGTAGDSAPAATEAPPPAAHES